MTTAAHPSDRWVWTLVALASCGVLVLAIVQGRKPLLSPAPASTAVKLPLLDGGTKALPAGQVTLVDFWATWCAPCRASMPRVQKLFEEYRGKGFELYSVDTDDPGPDRDPQVREFLLQNRLSFPVVLDDGSATTAFSIASLPTMLLLDRKGSVVWRHIGTLTAAREKDLRTEIDRALGQR